MQSDRDCATCREHNCICPHSFAGVTLTLPANSQMPVPSGKWERLPDGRIQARYTFPELWWAMRLVSVIAALNLQQIVDLDTARAKFERANCSESNP